MAPLSEHLVVHGLATTTVLGAHTPTFVPTLVAVGNVPETHGATPSAYTGNICYSIDGGTTWEESDSAYPNDLIDDSYWLPTCLGFGNGLFVAGGTSIGVAGDWLQSSPDGITWTAVHTPFDSLEGGYPVTIIYGNGIWLAVWSESFLISSVEYNALISTNGTTWTLVSTILNTSILYDSVDKVFISGLSSTPSETGITSTWEVSANGTTWTAQTSTEASFTLPYPAQPDPKWADDYGAGIIGGAVTGANPATSISQWLPLLNAQPPAGLFGGPAGSGTNMCQALYLDSSGSWNYGGWNSSTYNSLGEGFHACGFGPSTTPLVLGAAPSDGGPTTGLSGWTSMSDPQFGFPYGSHQPPGVVLAAVCGQGGPPGDFYLASVSSGWPLWARPGNIPPVGEGPSTGTSGGPTIGGSVVSGYDKMWIYGPISFSLLNGNGVLVGVQGSDANGENPSPLYLISCEETTSADFSDFTYYGPSSLASIPAHAGKVGSGSQPYCAIAGNYSRGDEVPVESCTVIYAYQPNGDGTYSVWFINDYMNDTWVKTGITLDVELCTGGFYVDASNIYMYVVGYSPSVGTNLFLQIDIAAFEYGSPSTYNDFTVTQWGAGQATKAGNVYDGFAVDQEYELPYAPITPRALNTIVAPVTAGPLGFGGDGGIFGNTYPDTGRFAILDTGLLNSTQTSTLRTFGIIDTISIPTGRAKFLNSQIVSQQSNDIVFSESGVGEIVAGQPAPTMTWDLYIPAVWTTNKNYKNITMPAVADGPEWYGYINLDPSAETPLWSVAWDFTYGNGTWLISLYPVMSAVGPEPYFGYDDALEYATPGVQLVAFAKSLLPTTGTGTYLNGEGLVATFFNGNTTDNQTIPFTTTYFDGNYFWAGLTIINGPDYPTTYFPPFPYLGSFGEIFFDGADTGVQAQPLWRSLDGVTWEHVKSPFDGVANGTVWTNGWVTAIVANSPEPSTRATMFAIPGVPRVISPGVVVHGANSQLSAINTHALSSSDA